jgi:hypothetical protein
MLCQAVCCQSVNNHKHVCTFQGLPRQRTQAAAAGQGIGQRRRATKTTAGFTALAKLHLQGVNPDGGGRAGRSSAASSHSRARGINVNVVSCMAVVESLPTPIQLTSGPAVKAAAYVCMVPAQCCARAVMICTPGHNQAVTFLLLHNIILCT